MLQIVKVEQDDELREFDPDAFLEARPKPIKSKQTKLKFSPQEHVVACGTAKQFYFFANASDGPYLNERSGACVKTVLHTRGSRLRRFTPSENV